MGNLTLFMAIQLGVAAIFFGLYFWSRKSPLPASIVGLCLYATMVAINVVVTLGSIKENEGRGGIGVGILDIVIIVILARAIQAGLKHKRILEQQQVSLGFPPVMPPPLR